MSTSEPRQPRYPLATSSWGPEEYQAIQDVLTSGQFSMGERVQEFEIAFASLHDSRYSVMVNSGSSANLLMVAALFYREVDPLKRGDEVLVPAVSWSTTYFPLSQYGLRLKFVDIDPLTLNYDLNALRSAISDRTRLVMAVNLLGNPNDFSQLAALLPSHVTLIEDNCEALGARLGGKLAGTFGVMGSFSTFFSHHIATMEGGVICTDDEELAHILICLRAHGWTRNLPRINRVTGIKSDDPFDESFKFVLPGYNVRPLEIEAAIGTQQLRKLPAFVEQRRANAARFSEVASRFSDHFDMQQEIGESSWFGFSIVLREGEYDRQQLVEHLGAYGIECRPIVAGNFAKNPAMRFIDHDPDFDLPNAERVDSHGLFLGNQERSLDRELDALDEALARLWTT